MTTTMRRMKKTTSRRPSLDSKPAESARRSAANPERTRGKSQPIHAEPQADELPQGAETAPCDHCTDDAEQFGHGTGDDAPQFGVSDDETTRQLE